MSTEDTTPAGTEPAEDDTTPADTPPAEDDTTPAGTEPAEDDTTPAGTEPAEDDEDEDGGDGDTFPRSYVKRLRERSAGYRARAKDAEARTAELERALFTERVRALDVLADPSDLPFDAALLEDSDALRAAADDLVARRPHYRRRGIAAGTGSRDEAGTGSGVSLLGLMRGGA